MTEYQGPAQHPHRGWWQRLRGWWLPRKVQR